MKQIHYLYSLRAALQQGDILRLPLGEVRPVAEVMEDLVKQANDALQSLAKFNDN